MMVGDETNEAVYTYDELSALTKAELLVIAEEKGITTVTTSNLKEEIIQAILGAAE